RRWHAWSSAPRAMWWARKYFGGRTAWRCSMRILRRRADAGRRGDCGALMFPPSRHGWFAAVADRIRGRALWVFPLSLLLLLAPGSFRPVSAQEGPVAMPEVCRIGVNIESLYDLDMARDTFGAILWVWSLCPSDELAPLNTIEFPSASAGLNLGPIEMLALPSGGQYTSRRVQGTFRHNWDMTHYPFDRQHVVIPMDETLYSAGRVTFEADERESF